MGRPTAHFVTPRPVALGRGQKVKRSNIIKFQLQSHFQRFLYQILRVFSQIKDLKHIKQDFHFIVWVRLWGAGVPRGSNISEHGHVAYYIDEDDEQNRMQVKQIP